MRRQVAWPALLLLCFLCACLCNGEQTVMPWLCLERCDNQTQADVKHNVAHVNDLFQRGLITAVSFERFNLGPNGTLVLNVDLSDVAPMLADGLAKYPMISSFPYPPEFLSWMRQVFAAPQPFINKVVGACQRYGYSGVNVDWEPTAKATKADALQYARFLALLRQQLATHRLHVSVDFAGWNAIWDWQALASADVAVAMMSTYTGNNTLWERALNRATAQFTLDNLVVGLQSIDPNTGGPLTHEQLSFRFDRLKNAHVKNIAVWRSPIPADWIPYLKDFISNNN